VLSGKLDGLGFAVWLTPFDSLPFTVTGPRHQFLPLIVRHASDELQRRADKVFHGGRLRQASKKGHSNPST
jgi:hypothetical protein